MIGCRVVGCVALGSDGLCVVHRRVPADELHALVERKAGLVAPLQRVTTRIEYERPDGSQFGYDDEGRMYEVTAAPAPHGAP